MNLVDVKHHMNIYPPLYASSLRDAGSKIPLHYRPHASVQTETHIISCT